MDKDLAQFLTLCFAFLYMAFFVYLAIVLWRITVALEKLARNQVEMTRDIKRIAQATVEMKEPTEGLP